VFIDEKDATMVAWTLGMKKMQTIHCFTPFQNEGGKIT
jgi:hypothetical protein